MGDLALDLFAAARGRYESALRWQSLALAALLGFYLTIMAPYADLSAERAALERALRQQRQVAALTGELAADLAGIKDATVGRARALAAETLADLRIGFDRLNAVVAAIRRDGPDAPAAAGPPPFPGAFPPMQMQMQLPRNLAPLPMQQMALPPQAQQMAPPDLQRVGPGLPSGAVLPPLDPDLRRRIAGVATQSELLEAVRPYVEAAIVGPAFERFRRTWREEALPAVEAAVARLAGKAQAAQAAGPEHGRIAAAVAATSAAILDAARRLELRPGGDPHWWETVPGKGAVLDTSLEGIAQRVEDLAPIDREVRDLSRRVEALLAERQALRDEAAARIKELEQRFRDQQHEVAAFAEPLKAVSLDLGVIAPLYPLLLGAMLAALIAWPGSRLLELRDAVALLSRTDAAPVARAWLVRRAGGDRRRIDLSVGLAGLLALLWLGLAAAQLRRFPDIDPQRLAVLALAGGVLVLAACLYRRRACRAALEAGAA